MDNRFINEVCGTIKDKNAKEQIRSELEIHLSEKIDYYVEIGYTEDEAERKATEDMGSAEDISVTLNSLHIPKWYKDAKTVVVFSATILFIIARIIIDLTDYHIHFMYGAEQYSVDHNIVYDFIATGIFILICLGIHIARKDKNFRIAIFLVPCVSFLLSGKFIFPFLYSYITIIGRGLGYYTDNIFTHSIVQSELKGYYEITQWIAFSLLLIYLIFVYIGIHRHQRMKVTKNFWKPFKIVEKAVAVILAVNLVIMVGATAFAYLRIDDTISENERLRENAFDLVIQEKYHNKSKEELAEILTANGYEEGKTITFENTDTYVYNNQDISVVFLEDKGKINYLSYSINTLDDLLIDNGRGLNIEDLDKFKKGMYQDVQSGENQSYTIWWKESNSTTIDEFLQYDLALKCQSSALVFGNNSNHNREELNYSFNFRINNSDEYSSVQLNFQNNRLSTMVLWSADAETEDNTGNQAFVYETES